MANNDKSSKPKRKSVESTFADMWEPENIGDELAGRYLGNEEAKGNKNEPFTVYHIEDDNQKKWSVAGAQLNSIMNQIPRGSHVFITYKGEQDLSGNRKMKTFSVDVADGVELIDVYANKGA